MKGVSRVKIMLRFVSNAVIRPTRVECLLL